VCFMDVATSYPNRVCNFSTPLNVHSFLFSPTCSPSNIQTLLPLPPALFFVMPANPPGPWKLDNVKKRLRAEQVAREKAASARYRRQEDKLRQQRIDSKGQTSACQCSVLLVLGLCCFLLSLAVLVLSSVVVRISKLG
jgi:hypothetical protein